MKISVSLRGVPWQKSTRAEPGNVEANRFGPASQPLRCVFVELVGRPPQQRLVLGRQRRARRRAPVRDLARIGDANLREHRQLAVAVNELHGHVQREQPRKRFARHRTWKDVAAHHDAIDVGLTNLVEDRFQRRKVRVNVVERGEPHPLRFYRRRVLIVPRRPVESLK